MKRLTLKVRKECGSTIGCPDHNERCSHSWLYAPMIHGKRKPRVWIDEYAVVHDGPRHVRTEEQAKQWAARIQQDWLNNLDPRLTPAEMVSVAKAVEHEKTVTHLVIAYRKANAAHPELDQHPQTHKAPAPRLKQPRVIWSELHHIAEYFGNRTAGDLESVENIRDFRLAMEDGWAPKHTLMGMALAADRVSARGASGVRSLLVRLRAVINWGMGQDPAWLKVTPFRPHGIVLGEFDDTRTRRLHPMLPSGQSEEQALIEACRLMADAGHKFAGFALERRIRGALELAGRGSDLDRVRLGHVVFNPVKGKPYVVFVGRARNGGKAKKDRHVPFDPHGPLMKLLERRKFLKPPHDFVFGDENGDVVNHFNAWCTARLLAYGFIKPDGHGRTPDKDCGWLREIGLQFRDLRRECASRWCDKGLHIARIQDLLGHSTLAMTKRYLQLPDGENMSEELSRAMGWDG